MWGFLGKYVSFLLKNIPDTLKIFHIMNDAEIPAPLLVRPGAWRFAYYLFLSELRTLSSRGLPPCLGAPHPWWGRSVLSDGPGLNLCVNDYTQQISGKEVNSNISAMKLCNYVTFLHCSEACFHSWKRGSWDESIVLLWQLMGVLPFKHLVQYLAHSQFSARGRLFFHTFKMLSKASQ